jgi:hypothetical protein
VNTSSITEATAATPPAPVDDRTHDVFNQADPLQDVDLFELDRPLQDALAHWHPGFDRARLGRLGRDAGSAELQAHARLANVHGPVLQTHDMQGRRIDQVEFHPSYHVLMTAALRHRLHATPFSEGPGAHLERAAGFVMFTQVEPSVLCPVSMSYAVTPALRANPALHADWSRGLGGKSFRAVLNIGHRPTIQNPTPESRVEVHLLDFTGELYGQELEITFAAKLRDEQKFSSLDQLKAQIARDVVEAKRRF